MIEVKTTVFKLYSFISKMMILVEKDLDNPHLMDGDEAVSAKKNMTNIFEKLVSLVIQLNRLSKDEQLHLSDSLPEEDMQIIERFMEKYAKRNICREGV